MYRQSRRADCRQEDAPGACQTRLSRSLGWGAADCIGLADNFDFQGLGQKGLDSGPDHVVVIDQKYRMGTFASGFASCLRPRRVPGFSRRE